MRAEVFQDTACSVGWKDPKTRREPHDSVQDGWEFSERRSVIVRLGVARIREISTRLNQPVTERSD
jgi:hypothetical protein